MTDIIQTIRRANNILDKYEKAAIESGERFNIFKIMGMQWNEVNTHSAIIGELLNPKGTHHRDDLYLKLFIDIMNEKFSNLKIQPFKLSNTTLTCEKIIQHNVNLENAEGGRIDIIIEDNDKIIIIENKPGYSDQPLQLIRYYNYAKKLNKEFYIFYLTIDGRDISKVEEIDCSVKKKVIGHNFNIKRKEEYDNFPTSSNVFKCIYYPISFKEDIKTWIIKAIDLTKETPLIEQILKQYLINLYTITNQNSNHKMNDEIEKILSIENVKSIEALAQSLVKIREKIKEEVIIEVNKELKKHTLKVDNGIVSIRFDEDNDGIFTGFQFFENGTFTKNEKLFIFLNNFNQKGSASNYHFYWYYPISIGIKNKFKDMDSIKILNLNRNKAELEKFISDIIEEALNNFERLKEYKN